MDNTISVIGGGWSLGKLAAEQRDRIPGFRIGVNDSGIFLRCDRIISMDRLWVENRFCKLAAMGRPTWLRNGTTRNCDVEKLRGKSWLRHFACDHTTSEFSAKEDVFNGTNSGLCALNMAWQLASSWEGRTRILLWGFDMCRSEEGVAYWYPPYPWSKPMGGTGNGRYKEWSGQFDQPAVAFAFQGAEVLNASLDSKIPNFPKVDPRMLLS